MNSLKDIYIALKDNKFLTFVVCAFLFFTFSVYAFDLWQFYDGMGFFFKTFIMGRIYNGDDITRLGAVYQNAAILLVYLYNLGGNVEVAKFLFSFGSSIHYLYPLIFVFIALKKNLLSKAEVTQLLSWYSISFFYLKACSFYWTINEFMVAHSLGWLLIFLLKGYFNIQKRLIFRITFIIITYFLIYTHPFALPVLGGLFLVAVYKRDYFLFLLFTLSGLKGLHLLNIYLTNEGGVYGAGPSHFINSALFIFISITTFVMLKSHRYTLGEYIILLLLNCLLFFLVPPSGVQYYVGRHFSQLLTFIVILMACFSLFYKKTADTKRLQRISIFLSTILIIITIKEGLHWKKDQNKIKHALYSQKGEIDYFGMKEVIPYYIDYSNSWTQRMMSLIYYLEDGREVESIIFPGFKHEHDTIDGLEISTTLYCYERRGGKVSKNLDLHLLRGRLRDKSVTPQNHKK